MHLDDFDAFFPLVKFRPRMVIARVAQSNLISKDSSIYSSASAGNDAGSYKKRLGPIDM